MNVLIIGYFGRNNLGDDLMLINLLNFIREKYPKASLSVVLHDINAMKILTNKVKIISSSDRLSYIKALYSSDIVIWGGGTCFYDSGSKLGNRGLDDLIKIGLLCRLFKTKLIFLGVGVGKVTKNVRNKIKTIFKLSHAVYLRENYSSEVAKKIYQKDKFFRSGDLALLSNASVMPEKIRDKKYITFSGVYNYSINIEKICEILEYLSAKLDAEVYFIPCHRDPLDDNSSHEAISKELGVDSTIFDIKSIEEYVTIIKGSSFHIGVRLHSLVLADLYSVPNIGLEYSPKIKNYINSTLVLEQYRCFEDISMIDFDILDKVINRYQKPNEFIDMENIYTFKAIERIFNDR